MLTDAAVGCTVAVRTVSGRTAYGEPELSTETVDVDGVLVDPGDTSDLGDGRREGARSTLTLHWPEGSCGMALKGAVVTLPEPWAGDYRVVGDPKPYAGAACPTPWRMPVEVEAVDG